MTEPTTPTAEQFAAMLAEYEAADELLGSSSSFSPEERAAEERFKRAAHTILAARPIEPEALAAQLRWLIDLVVEI